MRQNVLEYYWGHWLRSKGYALSYEKAAALSPTDQFSVESRWFYMQDGPGCEYKFREPGIHQETCLSCREMD